MEKSVTELNNQINEKCPQILTLKGLKHACFGAEAARSRNLYREPEP
jgi:hypothetical protein